VNQGGTTDNDLFVLDRDFILSVKGVFALWQNLRRYFYGTAYKTMAQLILKTTEHF
jgi:hypothetical protein